MSKKELLAKTINIFMPNVFYKYLRLINKCSNKLTVLAYHRVMDVNCDYPFDIELISASCSQFDEQMKFISEYFNPITIEQLIEYYKNSTEIPENSILITFDDGFEDNYKNAFPILEKHKVPATIFLSTDYVSSGNVIWFDQLSYFILNREEEVVRSILKEKFNIEWTNRRDVLEIVMDHVKRIPNSDRLILLDGIYNEYGSEYDGNDKELSSILSWEQIKEMDKSCISFGSHTLSHPVLSQLTYTELQKELIASKKIIENNLSHPIESIAYPVGTKFAFNDMVIDSVKEAGYSVGFSYLHGLNKWPLQRQHTINRLHIERYTSIAMFKYMLIFPKLLSY